MNPTKKDLKKALAKVEKTSIKLEIHALIRSRLSLSRSRAEVFREIAEATGITVAWLQKFEINPNAGDPGLGKIETLFFYFKGVSISDILKKG